MTCRQLIDFIDSYLEGELPRMTAASFRFHLLLCGHCRQYLSTYRNTIEAARLSMTPNAPVPDRVPEALVKAIEESLKK